MWRVSDNQKEGIFNEVERKNFLLGDMHDVIQSIKLKVHPLNTY